MISPFTRIALAGALIFVLSAASPAVAAARTGAQVAEIAAAAERAWAALTDPVTGAVYDRLQPGPHTTRDFNYGTFMLADAQLRTAARTGDGALAAKAVGHVLGFANLRSGVAPGDPFSQLAAGTLIADGRAGRLPADAWARIHEPLEQMARRILPFTGHGFDDPQRFDNWRLVWAAAAVQLAQAGIVGEPGAITENPAALRAEVVRIVNELVPANGGPVVRTPYGSGRALSDRPDQPLAYHVFSAVLLERIYQSDPAVFGPAALAVREQMGNYALALMAPDGDLTPSGRSIQQSWVLGAAADLGAMRAGQGGPSAGRWRAFAERAVERLVRVHGTFADGTIPTLPGFMVTSDPAIADHYNSMSQYNGLTLFFLQHAADQWPDHVALAPLAGDRDLLMADLGSGGPALAWGRAGNVWWAIQGRNTRPDSRATQGIVALKVRTPAGWRDRLASRPLKSTPRTDFLLRTRSGAQARLELTSASGSGRRAVLTGRWVTATGRIHRTARWDVRVRGSHLIVTTEPMRSGERLSAALWATAEARRAQTNARVSSTRCIVSASGRACPRTLRHKRPGRVRVTL